MLNLVQAPNSTAPATTASATTVSETVTAEQLPSPAGAQPATPPHMKGKPGVHRPDRDGGPGPHGAPGPHGTMTTADGAPHGMAHADPEALGMNATAWVSLAMAILLGILIWKKAHKAIAGSLDKKIAEIRSQLDEANKLRSEAESLRGEYLAKLQQAETDVADMRARAEDEAASIVAKAKDDTAAMIERRQQMAEDRIAAAERAAIAEVREKAASTATKAAETLIQRKHNAAADQSLVDETIAALNKL